jgi:hypothetical protein
LSIIAGGSVCHRSSLGLKLSPMTGTDSRMKAKTLSAVIALPMLVASLIGTSAAASAATSAGTAAHSGTVAAASAPDQVLGFWYTAQENYFNDFNSCQRYGYGATNNGNGWGNGYIPGTTNWSCYANPGQKYSIDLYMEG